MRGVDWRSPRRRRLLDSFQGLARCQSQHGRITPLARVRRLPDPRDERVTTHDEPAGDTVELAWCEPAKECQQTRDPADRGTGWAQGSAMASMKSDCQCMGNRHWGAAWGQTPRTDVDASRGSENEGQCLDARRVAGYHVLSTRT
ncbi:hypothetical protein NDU88_003047 [Pleurodeles waltl]|uniref:Uncharacterized protein n=1 Tax=Pleurodeles waltl TaxID=8319 RepID=A0AAV7P8G1_PLEWA|nr:hypothetical protein NDU88_003047 [Pleurodeles waltl]